MNYFLIKSEPFEYSFDQLEKDGSTMWDGVRNYAARMHLRAMKKGDLALYYHSRKGLEVVGIAKVTKEYYPDPTAEKGDWSAVDFIPHQRLAEPVTLKAIKANDKLQQMPLVRIGRLSVMQLEKKDFMEVLKMGKTKLKK